MPVTEVTKDPKALTMTVVADLAAPIERAWRLLADPRQLERWWGPPEYPATVAEHDLTPGGRVLYYMTGPEGDQPHGWWRVVAVEAPRYLEVEDGFGDDAWNPLPDMPAMTLRFTLEETPGGSRMTMVSTFESREAMEQVLAMGAEEGIRAAAGQMDAILAVPA